MFLSITTTYEPATDLGYLLLKNPANVHTKELSFGQAHIFFPEASENRCTACLMLEVDPVALVRTTKGREGFSLGQYVNDRPYTASSLLANAISRMYGTAMSGRCKERPELANQAIPLTVKLPVVASNGGKELVDRLFTPLGYEVEAEPLLLDEKFPSWGSSKYYSLVLKHSLTIADLLRQLYILIPVLDPQKHYWVAADEVDKIVAKGEGWLADHPEKDYILKRYLKFQRSLYLSALERLSDPDEKDTDSGEKDDAVEKELEKPVSLNQLRQDAVMQAILEKSPSVVADLGCGEGRYIKRLLRETKIPKIIGMDVSLRALQIASDRLKLDRMPPTQKARLELFQGSLLYVDERLHDLDVAIAVEVIEHLDPQRLYDFEQTVLGKSQPKRLIITTPNTEYNAVWDTLPADEFRHQDHRFEWSRGQFQEWAHGVADKFGYEVKFRGIGPLHEQFGTPTQMGVFDR